MSESDVEAAFKFVVDAGADAINNSWGLINPNGCKEVDDTFKPYIENGIKYAKEKGRNGLGTIVIFAAGNDSCNINTHPELSSNDIILVSALKRDGRIATYSNFGDYIDLSVRVGDWSDDTGKVLNEKHGIPSTDVTGDAGYNSKVFKGYTNFSDTNYTKGFFGTSAAAPVVTGAVGLMFSANPEISWVDAMKCIKNAVDKNTDSCTVDYSSGWSTKEETYNWQNQNDPHIGTSSHSACFGYGVLNVEKLVLMASNGDCGEVPDTENPDNSNDSEILADADAAVQPEDDAPIQPDNDKIENSDLDTTAQTDETPLNDKDTVVENDTTPIIDSDISTSDNSSMTENENSDSLSDETQITKDESSGCGCMILK